MTDNEETTNPSRRTVLTGAAAVGLGMAAASRAAAQSEASGIFAGKSVLITGAARGIGKACALSFAEAGANVTLFDIAENIPNAQYDMATEEDLAGTKTEVEAFGVRCLSVKGDVRDRDALDGAVSQTVNEFGGLDFLIVNAGVSQIGPLDSHSNEDVQMALDVNLTGAVNTVQAAIPVMVEQNAGRIVLISSAAARTGSRDFPIYSIAKWGMLGLTKATALTYGQSNITANAICPGVVRTELAFNRHSLSALLGEDYTDDLVQQVIQSRNVLPIGTMEPDAIADSAVFLCSEQAKHISGEALDVAAGMNARNSA